MKITTYTIQSRLISAVLILVFLSAGMVWGGGLKAQEKLPVPDKTQLWVNDYAGVFSQGDRLQLEQKLRNYANRTSTQILVVTLDDNQGYPASMLAPMIGERWQVGQSGEDNGLIILMDMQDRDVFISTGYGLEEYVPDAITKRIVENEVVPSFKEGDFFGGIDAATDVIIDLLDGKFTADEYRAQHGGGSSGGAGIGGIIFMIILFSIFFGGRGRRSTGMGRSNLPLWIALGMLSGGRSHSGSWGSFSGGSGGFGGGGGGFGGFSGGGGSFGGGGAGGSW